MIIKSIDGKRSYESASIQSFICGRSGFTKDFRGLDFSGMDLAGGSFRSLDLSECNFSNCFAFRADFTDTILVDSVAHHADFSSAEFRGANLARVKFDSCRFSRCTMKNTHLVRANFTDCNFRGVYFRRCSMKGASFTNIEASPMMQNWLSRCGPRTKRDGNQLLLEI